MLSFLSVLVGVVVLLLVLLLLLLVVVVVVVGLLVVVAVAVAVAVGGGGDGSGGWVDRFIVNRVNVVVVVGGDGGVGVGDSGGIGGVDVDGLRGGRGVCDVHSRRPHPQENAACSVVITAGSLSGRPMDLLLLSFVRRRSFAIFKSSGSP